MPIEETTDVERFLSEFSLKRDESGLSVFIPGIPSSVDSGGLLLATVRDYYWPILKGDLVVEVVDRLSGETTTVCAENLSEVITHVADQGERLRKAVSDTEHRVEIVREILELKTGGNPNWFAGNDPIMSHTAHGDTRGAVTKDCFAEDNLGRMLSAFEKGQLVGFSFSLKFETVDGEQQVGLVEVYFSKKMTTS